jgi:ubiquinone/menaquinone biosynthesis C-methylase UbiE
VRDKSASRYDFDGAAERYDQWYETARGAVYDRLEKKAIGRLLPNGGGTKKLLEIGCGTGHWSAFFSANGYHVTGVDVSEDMLMKARQKGIRNCRYEAADAHDLPFGAGRYDVVGAIATLEFVRQPGRVIAEMVRCARKHSGQLLLGVLNALSSANQERRQRKDSPYASAHFFSPEELMGLLASYGRVDALVSGFVPACRYLWPYAGLYDYVSRVLKRRNGAFIAARVRL